MKRRAFLKNSGQLALSSSFIYGLQNLLETSLGANRLFAQTVEANKTFIHFQFPGAPPKWYFDLPLNPHNRSQDIATATLGTEIMRSGTSYIPVLRHYAQNFGGQQIWLPPVWNLTSASSSTPFSDLLQHTMMIRGINMEINSHNVNRQRLLRPVSSAPSIHGVIADNSDAPLPAMGFNGSDSSISFKSDKGLSLLQVASGNPIPNVTSAFSKPILALEDTPEYMDRALAMLDDYARKINLPSQGSEMSQKATYDMLSRNLETFRAKWTSLYTKYQQIISQEMRANFPGITNINPVADGTGFYRRASGVSHTGALSALITSSTHINNMAQAFAFAEFASVEGLSSAINVDTGTNTMQGLAGFGNLQNDQHDVGVIMSIYFTSIFYRCFLGCMLELRNSLQTAGKFDSTLIYAGTEFSRSPRVDGSGSDHGFYGASCILVSGMVQTPGLAGNINKQPVHFDTARYPGTYGEAGAMNSGLGDVRSLVNDDVVNTICEIMEIKKVAVKGRPLIRLDGNKIVWAQTWENSNV